MNTISLRRGGKFYAAAALAEMKITMPRWHIYSATGPTGYGKKLSKSQAQLGQATCMAVA